MDHRPNCKCRTIKFLILGEIQGDLGYGNRVLNITPKAQSVMEWIDKLNLGISDLQKPQRREWEGNSQNKKRYL